MHIYRQGDTIIKWLKLAYKGTGEPVELTGVEVFSQMRREPGGDLIAEGSVLIDEANGLIAAIYSSDQTASLQPGEYGFDIRVKTGEISAPDTGGNTPAVIYDRTATSVQTLFSTRIKIVKPYSELRG